MSNYTDSEYVVRQINAMSRAETERAAARMLRLYAKDRRRVDESSMALIHLAVRLEGFAEDQ